jgi:hypothetical protein
MAKRRKSTALFEVFQSSNNGSSSRPAWSFSAPRWWRRSTDDKPGGSDRVVMREIETPPTQMDRLGMELAASEPSHPSRPPVRVSVDSVDQTVSLILSYSSAAVACFALVVVVGSAYVLGRHSVRGPLPLLAERTTEEVRKDRPNAAVLDVRPEPINVVARPTTQTQQQANKPSPKPQNWNDPRPSGNLMEVNDKRAVGLNYVIVQSYPDAKDAEEARNLLLSHNIICTVEPAPSNWARPEWKMMSVIGVTGFAKIHSDEFDEYVAKIQKVSDEMAGKPKFKRFDPKPYKWRAEK